MNRSSKAQSITSKGFALVIVLAFVVLLTGLVLAYFSRATSDRQSSNASFNANKVDELARSGLSVVLGDLKQEIVNGSAPTTADNYNPSAGQNILPMRSGNPAGVPDPIPNLIRRSVRSDPITAPGISSRASNVNSSTDASLTGHVIGLARWNKHYLIPRIAGATPTDTTPVASFTAPDWVMLSEQGPAAAPPLPSVIGRYAFAIYDEGGLLDVNVAGYPTGTIAAQFGPKGLLSFADLTATGMSQGGTDDIVGWRNYASSQPAGKFTLFTFNATSATRYVNYALSNTNGFLRVGVTTWNGRTDQAFLDRQSLIELRGSSGFTANALQYLGTFSRESNTSTTGGVSLRRFLISKIADVDSTQMANPVKAAAVKANFGLSWNVDHWDYVGATGTSLASSIPPIVANQAPEFFQLLNYGMPGATMNQVLSAGASIIDQYDSGAADITTVIEYAGTAAPPPPPAPAPPNPRAYGVESANPPIPATAPPPPTGAVILNRPLRSVGEFGYAYRDAATSTTLNFFANASTDKAILDLFSFTPVSQHAGVVNLNGRNSLVIAALIAGAIEAQPGASVTATRAKTMASNFVTATTAAPAQSRGDIPRLTQAISASLGAGEERNEVIARALAEVCQTRTWNLMIDLIAQSGRCPSSATTLSQFVVEGEKRYWLHVAIDRFTGQIIDQQLEAVYE